MTMNLAEIVPSTIEVEIRHPATGKATGLVITATSLDSEAVKKVKRQHANKMLRNRNRKPTAEEFEESNIDLLVAAIVGWEWKGGAAWTGGKKLDFTPENVRTVLAVGWLKSQVEEAISDEAAFFTS